MKTNWKRNTGWITSILIAAAFLLFAQLSEASGFCSQTAETLFSACKAEVSKDTLVKKAICTNFSNADERDECFNDLNADRKEELQSCREQLEWRLDACKLIGEERYDPEFDSTDFDHNFTHLTNPNPYFPLAIGNHWRFVGAGETNTIDVLNRTKTIDGITCIVVRDKVFKHGALVENTDDWFAQSLDKNVWYCGEEVKDYESFEGDKPAKPELVSNNGSFKAGRDDDKPGIIFLASPKKGDVYIEEFSLGNAEDVTLILSANYSFGSDPQLDQFVPQQLVQKLCSRADCVVTSNFSLLEPGITATKYYAKGIGFFLEVENENHQVIQLVECNFDSRCDDLPTP